VINFVPEEIHKYIRKSCRCILFDALTGLGAGQSSAPRFQIISEGLFLFQRFRTFSGAIHWAAAGR